MELSAALDATWPAAETVETGPWTLRRGAGGGQRVSAATLNGRCESIEVAESGLLAWGQRPLFMVQPGQPELDAELEARGYAIHDPCLAMGVGAGALEAPDEGSVIFCEGALATMQEIWAAGGTGPARLAVMDRVSGSRCWLLGRAGDRAAGCAFVARHERTAMIHAIEVLGAARGQGLGAQLLRGAGAWARAAGADSVTLVVTKGNQSARRLYDRLGLQYLTEYHYRRAPVETGA